MYIVSVVLLGSCGAKSSGYQGILSTGGDLPFRMCLQCCFGDRSMASFDLYYSILIYTYLISLKSPIYQEPLQALCVYELDRLRAQPLHGFVTKQIEDPQKSLRSKVGFPLLYISLHPAEKEGWIVSHTHTHPRTLLLPCVGEFDASTLHCYQCASCVL